jgi:hypothetical protein
VLIGVVVAMEVVWVELATPVDNGIWFTVLRSIFSAFILLLVTFL